MATSQVTVRDTQLEKQRAGLMRLSLTNFGNTSEPAIEAGSTVEIAGSLYVVTSDEAISGWSGISNDTDVYIKLVGSSGSFSASFVTAAPSWDGGKQGWYSGADRYIGGLHKGPSGEYEGKYLYQRSQSNNDTHRFRGDGTAEFDDLYITNATIDTATIQDGTINGGSLNGESIGSWISYGGVLILSNS